MDWKGGMMLCVKLLWASLNDNDAALYEDIGSTFIGASVDIKGQNRLTRGHQANIIINTHIFLFITYPMSRLILDLVRLTIDLLK